MNPHDNSVNIEKPRYHHGDLKTALLEAGMRLLAERTVEDMSLREVARSVGVSATAVYRHFPDKASLMRALAEEGLARLARAQHEAAEAAGGVRHRRGARDARIFASPPPAASEKGGREVEAMAFLRANAAAAVNDDPQSRAAWIRAVQAWSQVHGLAMLMLDGQIATSDALIDEVIDPDGCT